MEFLDLPPVKNAQGTVRLPGSKSISNRTLLLAALARGETAIHDLLISDDVERMLDALKKLGVVWRNDGGVYRVSGVDGSFPNKDADLFLGNAGTVFRPLTAALALSSGHYRLSGVPRMHERPIKDLVDALQKIGADVRYQGNQGFPPLEIFPAQLKYERPIHVHGDMSSQFLTGLLMALPLALPLLKRSVRIRVVNELISKPYVEITLNLMARFGVSVEREYWSSFILPEDASYVSPGTIHVEGDASSASYFLAAGAIAGGPVRVEGVGRSSIQGDVRFADELQKLGARLSMGENWIEVSGPQQGKLRAFDFDLNHIPDAAMTLAVLASFTDGKCHLRNIASWRVKETDRIAAMAIELRKLGAVVEEGADYLCITPPTKITPNVAIDTYDDHRMAMCFSLVSLAGVPIRINDPKCVAKTFPDYFERFAEIVSP
jgi:3-phosphoshikimate 1-carboxyvinyltransferase